VPFSYGLNEHRSGFFDRRTTKYLPFYFPNPHMPWQGGTNGLLGNYLPKSFDIALSSEDDIADSV